jgi:hypothetical protein
VVTTRLTDNHKQAKIMKLFNVRFQYAFSHISDVSAIAAMLSNVEKQQLSYAPWFDRYPYKPEVQFAIAYGPDSLFLQYAVKEKVIQAAHGIINAPVYQDSCVEFFLGFDEGDTYYNFEFNPIGTVLAGFGKGRANRELLPEAVLDKISFQAVIVKEKSESLVKWQLTVSIPFQVFLFHPLTSLQGQKCRANFYKCGDHLPQPHFLSWSAIQSDEPDFHLPQFFGALLFK